MKGRAWVVGQNVDTDQIYPGKYLSLTDPEEMAKHALSGVEGMEDFSSKVRSGDILIAGKNFGCGSSREHAPIALKYAGIAVVVAESFARIYYRNSINIGYPVLECGGLTEKIHSGDLLDVDLSSGEIRNERTGELYFAQPLSGLEKEITNAGGLIPYLKSSQIRNI